MKLADEIDETSIEEIRANFYTFMNEIITEHGDNQEGGQQTEEEEEGGVNA